MIRLRAVALAALATVSVIGSACRPAAAEWFADVFAGVSMTQSADLHLNDKAIGPGSFDNVEFDNALAWGGRAGLFFDAVPFLGLGVDYFHYTPYIGPQSAGFHGCIFPDGCGNSGKGGPGSFDITVNSISVDLMLRLPLLKSEEAPQGRVQPYLTVGPPLFITTITPRNTQSFKNQDGDTDFSFGLKAGGGVAVQIFKNLMLFGEYRFTHVSPDVELRDANLSRVRLGTDLDTHSVLVGLSARW
ncbi:MAG TPA: outer membrane beta-barrel protein [Methylomirabilota bacterium]|jgi:opacity protein-like surface antigen